MYGTMVSMGGGQAGYTRGWIGFAKGVEVIDNVIASTGELKIIDNVQNVHSFTDDLVLVRHHTDRPNLGGIKKSNSINASRGEPYGVDVEISPFVNPTQAKMGQAGSGSYVEFYIPRGQLITPPPGYMGGTGNAGRIITNGSPLNLSGKSPKFVKWNWLGF